MNLKIICISIGILATELLAAQDQTTELSLEQVVKIARQSLPMRRRHVIASVRLIGIINIIVPTIYRL